MNTYTKWLVTVIVTVLLIYFVIAGINFINDPLHFFDYPNRFNKVRKGYNERQQNVNDFVFHRQDFDAVLLGSSRATRINVSDFQGIKTFNMAASSMMPSEYNGYIEIAKQQMGKDFTYIIIASDFFGCNLTFNSQSRGIEPRTFLTTALEPGYRWRTLLSLKTLSFSIENLKEQDKKQEPRRMLISSFDDTKEYAGQMTVWNYSNEHFQYDEQYKQYLLVLKRNNPNAKFIVFTTPSSAAILKNAAKPGVIKYYQRWLRETVEVFGEVYDFSTVNSITQNPSNYEDVSHFRPEVGTLILHKIQGIEDKNIPADFGILLTTNTDFSSLSPITK